MPEPVSFRQVFHRKAGLIQEKGRTLMMGCREDTGSLEGGRAQRGGQSILRPQQEPLSWAGGGLAQSSGLWLGREGEEGIWAGAGGRALGCRWQALPREMMAVLYTSLLPGLRNLRREEFLGCPMLLVGYQRTQSPLVLRRMERGFAAVSAERAGGRGEGGVWPCFPQLERAPPPRVRPPAQDTPSRQPT